MRAIRILNLRRLTRIRLRLIVAVVAVAAGSSLALSVVIVNGSTSYSLNRLTTQVGGAAELRVVGATPVGGIDFATLAAVARTPGVRTALPVVQAISSVRTIGTRNQAVLVIGVNCAAASSAGGLGCGSSQSGTPTPSAPGIAIAPDLEHRLSTHSWLETNQGIQPLRHAVVLPTLDSVNRGDVVVMSLAAAQSAFTRDGRVDVVYVVPDPGTTLTTLQHRLAKAVGPQNGVVDATTAPASVSLALGAFTPVLALLALVASAIAVVLIYNVISLTLEERRRERAIVAAIGASPTTLIVGPLLEAGALGAVGGLLGTLGGVVLARPIVATLSHITLGLVGIPITLHTSSGTFVTGIIVGILIGLLAAVRPVLEAMRSDIAAEISGREQHQRASKHATVRRGLLYLALGGAGAAISWLGARNGSLKPWQPNAALLGFVVAMVLAIMAMGAWAPVAIRGIWRSGRLRQGVARLGVANLIREPGRTGVMAIAIGAAVSVAFITASYNRAIDQDISSSFAKTDASHGVYVTTVAAGNGYNTDGQIQPAVQHALARLPGVSRVDQFNGELTGHAVGQLVLVESDSHPAFADQTVYAGTTNRRDFGRGEVLVGANLARRDRLDPGSTLILDTPAGLSSVRVQGIWSNGDAAGDNVFMSSNEQQHLFGAQLPSALELIVAPHASASNVVHEADAAHLGPYLKFSTPSTQLHDADTGISTQLAPFNVLQRALLLVSFISVLSTLLLVGIQRRREFGLLGAVGMSPRELFRMVIAEGLTVSVVAVCIGAAFGFAMLAVMLNVTPLLVGYHDTYSPDLASLLLYGPIVVAVAVAAAVWPGRQAARTPILEALTYE
jgi:putative ABC transport system permease protein